MEALCAAPPEALAHSPRQMPLSFTVAPGRPELMELQATKPSPTPTRAEEDRVVDLQAAPSPTPTRRTPRRAAGLEPSRPRPPTSPGCRPRRAPQKTSHVAGLQTSRSRCPLAHADARGGITRRDAGLQTSRSRRQSARQSARKMSRKPSLGLPHQQRVSNVRKSYVETVRVGLKECALDQTCASWCSRFRTLR